MSENILDFDKKQNLIREIRNKAINAGIFVTISDIESVLNQCCLVEKPEPMPSLSQLLDKINKSNITIEHTNLVLNILSKSKKNNITNLISEINKIMVKNV